MGFNIAGVVVNDNYKRREKELAGQLGWDLEFVGEITFEEASANWKDEGIYDFYFSDNGTLIFTAFEEVIDAYSLKDHNVLTFCLSEMSMSFILHYSEGHNVKRSLIVSEDKVDMDEGEPLPEEKDGNNMSEVIWHCIDSTLGEKWNDIDFDGKAYRFRAKTEAIDPEELADDDVLEDEIEQLEADGASVKKRKHAIYLQCFWVLWFLALLVFFVTRGTLMGYVFTAVDAVLLALYAVRLKNMVDISRDMGDFDK